MDERKYGKELSNKKKCWFRKSSECYRDVFNGEPFYEDWTTEKASEVLREYKENGANMWFPVLGDEVLGFLVTTDQIPDAQKQFITLDQDKIRFIEEVGVRSDYRGNRIASELVRRDLKNALMLGKEYLAYRTNVMRYFRKNRGESFESAVERVQMEDKLKEKMERKFLFQAFRKKKNNILLISILNYLRLDLI